VRLPSLLGAPRLTVKVYGPAPEPLDAPFVQADEVPPIVTSAVVESKPVTDSLNVTEQLKDVAFVVVPLGTPQEKALTDGAWRSTTTDAGEPATAVWALPTVSATEKVVARVRLLVPVAPGPIDEVAGIVQVVVPDPVMGPIELMLPKVKSTPSVVEIVEQSRFSLPVSVNVRLVELVGLAVTAAKVRVGGVVSLTVVVTVFEIVGVLRWGGFGWGFWQFPEHDAAALLE
jgi:hypothetical protein